MYGLIEKGLSFFVHRTAQNGVRVVGYDSNQQHIRTAFRIIYKFIYTSHKKFNDLF